MKSNERIRLGELNTNVNPTHSEQYRPALVVTIVVVIII